MLDYEVEALLKEYLVDQFTHWENGKPITFIASLDQVTKLIDAAYERGRRDSLEGGV